MARSSKSPGISEQPAPYQAASKPKATARKRAVNLSLPAALIDEAKAAGLNLSHVVEQALDARLKEARAAAWARDHAAFIAWQKRDIDEDGLWSDGMRSF
jgi:antitoxin CcdA